MGNDSVLPAKEQDSIRDNAMSHDIEEKREDAIAKARAMIALNPDKVAEQMCDLVQENVQMLRKMDELRRQIPVPFTGTLNSEELTKKILMDLQVLYPGLGFLLVVAPQNHPEKGAFRASWSMAEVRKLTTAISEVAGRLDSKRVVVNWPKGPKS